MSTSLTTTEELVDLNGLDPQTYERMLGQTLHEIRESLDERISRNQVERALLGSEAHPYDLLEAMQRLALMVQSDRSCPHCADFDCDYTH